MSAQTPTQIIRHHWTYEQAWADGYEFAVQERATTDAKADKWQTPNTGGLDAMVDRIYEIAPYDPPAEPWESLVAVPFDWERVAA